MNELRRSTDACFSSDFSPSISATGEALIALDAEMRSMEQEYKMLCIRAKHMLTKMQLCHDAIKKLLVTANDGMYPPACPSGHFPELHSLD